MAITRINSLPHNNFKAKYIQKKSTYSDNNRVDLRNYFSKDEINGMIKRFPNLAPKLPSQLPLLTIGPNSIEATYIPAAEAVILNNKQLTNHTVEIYKNGKAVSVGSWHHTELDGDYSDIIKAVKSRIQK